MSLPHFDSPVTLKRFPVQGVMQTVDTFTVTGPLEPGQESQDFAILVSIWQTEEDATGAESDRVIARALGAGQELKETTQQGGSEEHPGKWSADLVMRDQGMFIADRPATALGLLVVNSGEPTSFETYSWMQRITFKLDP